MAKNDWLGMLALGGGIPAFAIGIWLLWRYNEERKKGMGADRRDQWIGVILLVLGIVLTAGGGYHFATTIGLK